MNKGLNERKENILFKGVDIATPGDLCARSVLV